MPNSCSVPECRGTGGFSFPSDPDLNTKWRVAIKRLGPNKSLWKPGRHSRVCDKHFTAEDFKEPKVKFAGFAGTGRTCRSLNDGVVPSIFLDRWIATAQRTERTEERKRKREADTEEAEDHGEDVLACEPAPEVFFDSLCSCSGGSQLQWGGIGSLG